MFRRRNSAAMNTAMTCSLFRGHTQQGVVTHIIISTHPTSLHMVPERLNRSDPVLPPAPLVSRGHGASLSRILVAAVSLHVILSVGGFIFLGHQDRKLSIQLPSSEKQETAKQQHNKAFARMVVEPLWNGESTRGYLQWDLHHSVRTSISYYRNSWLTILQAGDYHVYSRVTFSNGNIERPLVSRVLLRKNETGEEAVVMQAFCNVDRSGESASIPRLCTATQGDVIPLERGNQLTVWVPDLSLVDYEEGATVFGLYKL
ncbi:tumor necrosis factor ligand superfamily member 6-like [Clinocottus analis]|uniref:tumor necrosis factor ligand superfamily member 6-like n=1 Tax=Clinocottus analis TaxID=304258 RepID=UPI0035C1DD42